MKTKVAITALSVLLVSNVAVLAAQSSPVRSKVEGWLAKDIKVSLNEQVQTLKDSDGNVVYPLVYEGSTYLPVRAVSGLAGFEVDWDDATTTVKLTGGKTASAPSEVVPNSDPYKDARTSGKITLPDLMKAGAVAFGPNGRGATAALSVTKDQALLKDIKGKQASAGLYSKYVKGNGESISTKGSDEESVYYVSAKFQIPSGAKKVTGMLKALPKNLENTLSKDGVEIALLDENYVVVAQASVEEKVNEYNVYVPFSGDVAGSKELIVRVGGKTEAVDVVIGDLQFEMN